MDSLDEVRERRRRELREEDDIGEDERRERRRRHGWTEAALEEDDRRRAIEREENLRVDEYFAQVLARQHEEEEEEKKRDPACKAAMVALRVPAFGETRETDCAVCLEEFVVGGRKLRMMPCSHSFHQRCIFDWLYRNRRCPICRFAMKRDEEQAAAASVS